jgi:hypothetical protein
MYVEKKKKHWINYPEYPGHCRNYRVTESWSTEESSYILLHRRLQDFQCRLMYQDFRSSGKRGDFQHETIIFLFCLYGTVYKRTYLYWSVDYVWIYSIFVEVYMYNAKTIGRIICYTKSTKQLFWQNWQLRTCSYSLKPDILYFCVSTTLK